MDKEFPSNIYFQNHASRAPQQDGLLTTLVDLANLEALSVSVVLNTEGGAVYGQLVSVGRYLLSVADTITEHDSELHQFLSAQPSEWEGRDTPHFIHLSNATVSSGDVRQTVSLWRGRLDKISGYAFTSAPFEYPS